MLTFYVSVILLYVVFFLSFFVVYGIFRQEGKVLLSIVVIIYMAAGGLFSFFAAGEMLRPSEGPNIPLGFSMLVMALLSFTGIIASGIIYLVKKIRNRSIQ